MLSREWTASLVAVLLVGGVAFAASDEELSECRHKDDNRRIAGCTRIIENPANNAQHRIIGLNNRSLSFLGRGQTDRALSDLNEAIRLNPSEAGSYGNRAEVYRVKKEFDRALADLDEAQRLNPDLAAIYAIRGNVHLDRKNYKGAISQFDEAIRRAPNDANYLHARGRAFYAKGESARALADYNEAIRLGFAGFEAHHNRALLHSQSKQYDLAVADYSEAIRRRPNADSYNNRGNTYAQKNDFSSAIGDFSEAIKTDATYVFAYLNRALAYEALGRKAEAIADYRKALLLEASNKQGLSALKRLGAKPF